jgi:hypothetical protein
LTVRLNVPYNELQNGTQKRNNHIFLACKTAFNF